PTDDSVSGVSELDYQDQRLSQLEQRLQQQEDEITLLKSALADALRRICFYDQHFSMLKASLPGNPTLQSPFSALGHTERPSAKRSQSLSSAYDLSRHTGDTSTSFTGTKDRKASGIEALHRVRVQHPRGQAAMGMRTGIQESEFTVRNPPGSLVPQCLSHNEPDPHPIQPHTLARQCAGLHSQAEVENPGCQPAAQAARLQLGGESDGLPIHLAESGVQHQAGANSQQPVQLLNECTGTQLQPAETHSGDQCVQGAAAVPQTESNAAPEPAPRQVHPPSQDKVQQSSHCPFQALSNGIKVQQDEQWTPRASPQDPCRGSSEAVIPVAPLNGSRSKAESLPPPFQPEAAPHSDTSLSQLKSEVRAPVISANGSEHLQHEHSTTPTASPDSAQGSPSAAGLDVSPAPRQAQSVSVSKVLPQPQGSLEELDIQPRAPRSVSQAAQLSLKDGVASLPPVTAAAVSKKLLLRRSNTSDKLGAMRDTENGKPKLARKSASSINLLTKSRTTDSRAKDPFQTPAAASRRGVYNQEGISIKMFLRGRPITMYVPSKIQNIDDLKCELPAEKLKLDWVYGYRGRDSRYNLHLLSSGEIVYFIACVVVLFNIEERTQRHYLKHTDCVRCLAVHPDRVRIASGQTSGVDKDGKVLSLPVLTGPAGTLCLKLTQWWRSGYSIILSRQNECFKPQSLPSLNWKLPMAT
ncbi:uncharacterized protein LOC144490512, partial [Mustelus asterias]